MSPFPQPHPNSHAYPHPHPNNLGRGVSLVQISPKGGDIAGNVTVLLVGTVFEDFGDAKCNFGAATVRATVSTTRGRSRARRRTPTRR